MSAPMVMDSEDAKTLGYFLDGLTKLSADCGWKAGAYGPIDISRGGDLTLRIDQRDDGTYVVDDRVGD